MLSWALPSNGPARPGLLPAWTPPEPGTGHVALWGASPETAACMPRGQHPRAGQAVSPTERPAAPRTCPDYVTGAPAV